LKASESFAILFAAGILTLAAPMAGAGQSGVAGPSVSAEGAAAAAGPDLGATAEVPTDQVTRFRADFNKVLDHYEGVFRRLGHARGLRLISDARESLRIVSDAQLAKIFSRMKMPDLSAVIDAAAVLEAHTPVRGAGSGFTPGFPNAPPILTDCDNIVHDSGFTFGALVAFQVLRAVFKAAEFACQQVVVVLGEGGNTALACVPLAIAQDAAEIPYELADFCGGEEDSALLQGSYDRLDHIHTDLDAARAEIIANDNTNRDLIIANDNANRDILIAELRRLSCDVMRLLNTPEGLRESSNP